MTVPVSPQFTVINNGQPSAGAKVYAYQTGTTTPVTTYSDSGLTTPNTFPVVADANGQVTLYVSTTTALRLDLYTSDGGFIETVDPVYPAAISTGGTSVAEGTLPAAATTDLGSLGTTLLNITGSAVNITSFGSSALTSNPLYYLRFSGAVTIKYNATSMQNIGGADITTAAGATAIMEYLGSGNWKMFNYQPATGSLLAATVAPQGRLTLANGTPVMNADATAQSTVYYTPHTGNSIPIYNGAYFAGTVFSELSLALDSNSGHTGYHQSGKNFDLFVYIDSGTVRLGSGPAWSSDTSRGIGAGTTELQQLNGLWTNKNDITLRFGASSGDTSSVVANQATYVGTLRATANGQTGMSFKPSAASGGSNNVLGLYNAYNRVRLTSISRDNTATWSYGTSTWRASNNSNSNRVSFIDGLRQSFVRSRFQDAALPSSNANPGIIGVNINSTSATPNIPATVGNTGSTTDVMTSVVIEEFPPQLGFNYIQAMEYAVGASSSTFYGTNYSQQLHGLSVELEM